MSKLHFAPIKDRTEEIIEAVMGSAEVTAQPDLDFTLRLVVEEIVVNIVNYAYPEGLDGELNVSITANDTEITLVFSDSGTPFDPLAKDDPDTTLGIDERPIGGLGIFLVKQMMDTVTYRYENGCNILTMSKLL